MMPSVASVRISEVQWVVSGQLPRDLRHLQQDMPPAGDGTLLGDPLTAAIRKVPGYNGGGADRRNGSFYAYFRTGEVNEQTLRVNLAHAVRRLVPGRTLSVEIIREWAVTVEFSQPVPERLRAEVVQRLRSLVGNGPGVAWTRDPRKIGIHMTKEPQPGHFDALRKALSF